LHMCVCVCVCVCVFLSLLSAGIPGMYHCVYCIFLYLARKQHEFVLAYD
jgi:hypothetical protein